jgi:hypothetical protein
MMIDEDTINIIDVKELNKYAKIGKILTNK